MNPLRVIQAEQGDQIVLGDVAMNRIVRSESLPSRISVQEWTVQPHFLGVPPHTHQHEDEVFYVLEGQITIMEDDNVSTAGPGTYVVLSRGRLHAFWNSADVPARMLAIITPGQLETYFEAAAKFAPTDAAHDIEGIMRVSQEYGLQFRMDLIPELLAKYNLKTSVPAPAPSGTGV